VIAVKNYSFCVLPEKGFCILGESCPYDHGLDPVVIGSAYPHSTPGINTIGVPTLPPAPTAAAANHGQWAGPGRAIPAQSNVGEMGLARTLNA